jgi:hypothetical protein
MRSRWVCLPAGAVRDEALDPRNPVGQPVEITTKHPDSCVVPHVLVASVHRCRVVGDEHSAALVRLDELFFAQDVERVADGHRRDTVAAGQFPARGQALTRLERPVADARPQVVGHLQVGRPRIVRLWLHSSSVRRPSCLGRTAGLTEGLCLHLNCSSVFYIDLVQSS